MTSFSYLLFPKRWIIRGLSPHPPRHPHLPACIGNHFTYDPIPRAVARPRPRQHRDRCAGVFTCKLHSEIKSEPRAFGPKPARWGSDVQSNDAHIARLPDTRALLPTSAPRADRPPATAPAHKRVLGPRAVMLPRPLQQVPVRSGFEITS